MATPLLRSPDTIRDLLTRRFRAKHRSWLAGEGEWPLAINLGSPNENMARRWLDGIRDWVAAWQNWNGVGELIWQERNLRLLGAQQLPERLILHSADDIATWSGESARWLRARGRFQRIIAHWPELESRLPRYFDVLADYGEEDLQRVQAILAWLKVHPKSELYPRQLPIAGLDTKWLERNKALIGDLLGALTGKSGDGESFFQHSGLRQPPGLIRLRILDPHSRAQFGGLGDISSPIEEVAVLPLVLQRAYIVENLQSGLAFADLPESIVIMGLGYGVEVLAQIPWLQNAECLYWGDIDTHGFSILSRARSHLPSLKSILMDEVTLLKHRDLCVREEKPCSLNELPLLTNVEHEVYRGLKEQRWGETLRLEQERVEWSYAWEILRRSSI